LKIYSPPKVCRASEGCRRKSDRFDGASQQVLCRDFVADFVSIHDAAARQMKRPGGEPGPFRS
jgi:hypothetical protein